MDHNATVKGEVLRYMTKLAEATHTHMTYDRDIIGGYRCRYEFSETPTSKPIASFIIDYEKVDNIFEVMFAVKNELLQKVTAYKDLLYTRYSSKDVENTYALYSKVTRTYASGQTIPDIKDVIFNGPATIVFWVDGTKTVVKAQDDEVFDPEKGLAMAIAKKAFGNHGNYCNNLKPWFEKYKVEPVDNTATVDNVWAAYHRLHNALHDKKATKADLVFAMQDAVGYLGEEMDN